MRKYRGIQPMRQAQIKYTMFLYNQAIGTLFYDLISK
jgi:hypothetical protein